MKRTMLALAASALLAVAPHCLARQVQVLIFSFEIPDAWHFEGGGSTGHILFATSGATRKLGEPPYVLVEACVPTKSKACSDFRLPNPPKDLATEGCSKAVAQVKILRGMVEETRWVCETTKLSDGKVTSGISIFRFKDSFLYLAHGSEFGPEDVSRFMDGIAQSLTASAAEPVPPK